MFSELPKSYSFWEGLSKHAYNFNKTEFKEESNNCTKKGKNKEKILDSYVTRAINIPKISLC